jgi:drug/metabolite transporter (DMT)-like permease
LQVRQYAERRLAPDVRAPAREPRGTPISASSKKNYRLGVLYSVVTAFLLATQHPFSAIAAKKLSTAQFIGVTQFALLASVPLLLLSPATRSDMYKLASDPANWWKLLALFAIGVAGLVSYNYGLSMAHPIIIAAVLNLSPFWAALVALIVSRKAIPVSPLVFFVCLLVAFIGALVVAWSQSEKGESSSFQAIEQAALHGSWIYAVPVPIFFALSGTLVGKWFAKFEEAATVAVMFVLSAAILIPAALAMSYLRAETFADPADVPAIALLLIGTLIAAAAGRVVYQMALTATANDNGFVSMFLLLVPALTCLLSIPMSWWIPDLKFIAGPTFFLGLALIAAPLLAFSIQSTRVTSRQGAAAPAPAAE